MLFPNKVHDKIENLHDRRERKNQDKKTYVEIKSSHYNGFSVITTWHLDSFQSLVKHLEENKPILIL